MSRFLLLLLLELPPTRLVESHTILLEKFTNIPPDWRFAEQLDLSKELMSCLSELGLACKKKKWPEAAVALDRLFQFKSLDTEHYLLMEEMNKKCNQ